MVVQSEHVRDVMVPGVETINATDNVRVARRRFDSQTERSLVVAEDGRPIGIIEYRSIMDQNAVPAEAPISEFMKTEFPTLTQDMPLAEAQQALAGGDVDLDRIPVVDDNGMLVGVVARTSLARAQTVTQAAAVNETEPWGDAPPAGFSGPGQEAVATPEQAAGPQISTGMNVVGENGDKLGTVSEVLAGPQGLATHFMVQHGLLRKKHKRLPVDEIVGVNGDSVTVSMTSTEFGFLPDIEDQNQ